MSVAIHINGAVKQYGPVTIIPDLTADIKNGEFFTLLGPSGCGKTTLLRMIAGFNSVEGGSIAFDEQEITGIPAHKRNIGMVFQNYAIFPHLTVRQNVEYGLKLRKTNRDEMKQRVDEILDVVKITDYQERLPERLSGGQQQRVALARSIVIHPSVLLMDEPLSNLDAKLRVEMRSAIRDIQKKVGITTVYVTHDQEEALAVSDRIAIMNQGVIQQVAEPETIYSRPCNVFVSTFIGHSNLLPGFVVQSEQGHVIELDNGYRIAMDNLKDNVKPGGRVLVSVRPEEFSLAEAGLKAKIINRTFLGKYINYELQFVDIESPQQEEALEYSQDCGHAERIYQEGEYIFLKPNPKKINVFDADNQNSLIKDVNAYG